MLLFNSSWLLWVLHASSSKVRINKRNNVLNETNIRAKDID
jgi:hypothetical protein